MRELSRRNFMLWSSGAFAGNMLVGGLAEASDGEGARRPGPDPSRSGLVTGKPRPLKHASIPGFLTAEQIAPHHAAHYAGALRGYTAAESRLDESIRSGRSIDAATHAALKRSIVRKGNSVVLHELYFDGMAPQASDPAEAIRRAIGARFGSLEKWSTDFIASAREAAGWAILARHPVNGKLYNVVCDEHAIGALWLASPLIVLDTYEHAFYVDYQDRKAEYVEKFVDHIDWSEVAARDAEA